jgi:uncharacterized membrane protein
MSSESRHLSEWIDRPADEVYKYASDPANLPYWAPGLCSSVEKADDRWFVETSGGRRLGFAQEADEALRVLPDEIDHKQLVEFGDRYGLDSSMLTDRMGGSP